VMKWINKIETRRRGERRGFRGEELEGVMIFSRPAQNSALSSARSASLRFAETGSH